MYFTLGGAEIVAGGTEFTAVDSPPSVSNFEVTGTAWTNTGYASASQINVIQVAAKNSGGSAVPKSQTDLSTQFSMAFEKKTGSSTYTDATSDFVVTVTAPSSDSGNVYEVKYSTTKTNTLTS